MDGGPPAEETHTHGHQQTAAEEQFVNLFTQGGNRKTRRHGPHCTARQRPTHTTPIHASAIRPQHQCYKWNRHEHQRCGHEIRVQQAQHGGAQEGHTEADGALDRGPQAHHDQADG